MGYLVTLALIGFLSFSLAEDVTCPSKKSKHTVKIGSGGSSVFRTQEGDTYGAKTNCMAKYIKQKSCKKLEVTCSSFDLGKGDILMVKAGKKKYKFKGTNFSPVTSTSKATVVMFKSNKKQNGPGAECTIACSDAEQTTTPAPTTGEPEVTTGSSVDCVNCTTQTGGVCQFPFIYQGQTFTSCTSYDDTAPWCATKVDQFNNYIPGAKEWGYCTDSCPSDAGYPATGDGPACEVRTTGYGYPDSCAERLARDNKNILFLGNSYTYGNDLPGMVRSLASAAGKSATTTMVAPGGQTLSGHVSGGSLDTIRAGDWDAVVIQDQSQRPSFGADYVFNNILPDADAIVDAIRETNPCTRPVYYLTWGKRDGDSQNCNNGNIFCSFEGIQDQLTDAYTTMAYVTQPASVAPAGEAWRNYSSRNSLFAGDGSHASQSGTYLTACTMLETIWPGVSCVGNSYQPVTDAAALQTLAHDTVTSRTWSWPEAGLRPCEACLP